MKKTRHVRPDEPLKPLDVRFVRLLARLMRAKGRGPSVTEIEEAWSGSRSGIIERAHVLRAKGMLEWKTPSKGGHSWANMRITELFWTRYGTETT